eukprot:gnl/TRDRNA2_/TRDRNA2_85552_c0_seq1.p1 gnl/TRDRNA2_/TRDRNA2_85552_c0~~gnl/TRDRNA2_/TRDRNA2_85552_c0_seq1.p1  ORF type:complete len:754 (-),score=181.55 gnl/TRDRNA2_/TRDRNA2_85552_c0_seq1:136-2229(-)
MVALLATCKSPRIIAEVKPWLKAVEKRRKGPQVAEAASQSLYSTSSGTNFKEGSTPCGAEPAQRGVELASETVLEGDRAEMEALLAACSRKRVRDELKPWLAAAETQLQHGGASASQVGYVALNDESDALAELEADRDEMQQLLAGCRSRVARELMPWLGDMEGRMARLGGRVRGGMEPSTSSAPHLPTIVIAGARSTGTKQLLGALAATGESRNAVESILETKYYRARVCFEAVDLELGKDKLDDAPAASIRKASAIIFLWQLSCPDTFACVRSAYDAATDEQDDRGRCSDNVQLCVAIESEESQDGIGESDAEAREWCAENGFEHLRCHLAASDLEDVRARRCGAKGDAGGGLLAADCDDTPLRILEALENHLWPGLERKTPASLVEKTLASKSCESPEATTQHPLVLVAGAREVDKRNLVCALTGQMPSDGDKAIEAMLETKYYRARLRFRTADFSVDSSRAAEVVSLAKSAAGIILLWDTSRPETFAVAQQLYSSAYPMLDDDDDEEAAEDDEDDGVRLCIAVDGGGADADKAEEDARSWCARRGLQHMRCTLRPADLKAIRTRWANGHGAGLLCGAEMKEEDDVDDCEYDSATDIVEALECYQWQGLEKKVVAAPPGEAGATARHTDGIDSGCEQAEEASAPSLAASAEAFDQLSEDMRRVRSISDSKKRREQAEEVALRMAQFAGLSDDES